MADQETRANAPEINEVASLERDQEIFQGFLNVLENPDKVLRLEASGDITVYEDIGRDSRVGSNLRTRAQAVIGKEFEVIPYSDEGRDVDVAEFVKQVLLAFPFDKARRAILYGGVLKGFAISEVMWEASEGSVFIREMRHRAQRRFRFDLKEHLRLLTTDDPLDGIDLTQKHPRKFQTFVFGDEPETPYGVGLGRELYWPWWFKKNGIKFWLQFCERFGSPTAVGKYPRGASKDEKGTLLGALDAMRSSSSIIIPDGMSAELIEAAKSGSVSTQAELVRYMNEEISICILGQAGSTQGTPGRLGGEDAMDNVRNDLVKADADALAEYLNAGVVRWLVDYNFPGRARYPTFWIRAGEEADLNQMATRDKTLSEAGVRFKKSYFVGAYGLKDDEFEVGPPPKRPGSSGPEFAEGEGFTAEQQAVEDLAGEVAAQAANALAENEQRILEAIQQAESFDDAMARLLELYPQLQVGALQDLLERATLNADLFGRFVAGEDA